MEQIKNKLDPSLIRSLCILIVLSVTATVLSGGVFLQTNNLLNLVQQNAMLLFVSIAQLLVIATGGIDLSVGAVVAISSVMVVLFQGYGTGASLIAALGTGALIGLFSGSMVTFVKLPPFVVTLAVQQITYSLAKVMTNGAKVETSLNGEMLSMSFGSFYKMKVAGIPIPLILCIVLIVLMSIYMKTKYGYYIYAIGGNYKAARTSGLPVRLTNLLVYILASLMSALAGFLFVARVGTGDPDTGTLLSMDAIAACTIGGASLAGGKGTVGGTVIGLIVLCVLNNVMSLVHVSTDIQPLVKGIVILIAVFLNTLSDKKRK